jgi:hypothetical protein
MKKKTMDTWLTVFSIALAAGLLVIVFSLAVVFATAAIEHIRLLFR